jgi:hypothetical protein
MLDDRSNLAGFDHHYSRKKPANRDLPVGVIGWWT